MRALVDLRDAQIEALDTIARRESVSRAALIRKAVDHFLAAKQVVSLDDAFGLWGQGEMDGLAYQKQLRDEW